MKKIAVLLFSFPTLLSGQVNIDSLINAEMIQNGIPGASAVIVKSNGIAWTNSYGYSDLQDSTIVTDQTLFQLASVTKTFTTTAIMQLADSGLIDIDDGIGSWLPFTVDNLWSSTTTFRQLLTHTSSIKDNWPLLMSYYSTGDCSMTLDTFLFNYLNSMGDDYSSSNFWSSAPGSAYHYSNVGMALLGHLVERISGTSFNTYCKSNIFDRLCMDHSGFFLSEIDTTMLARPYEYVSSSYTEYPLYGYPDYPAGLLRTSTKEIANYLITYERDGNFLGDQLLDSGSVSEILSSQIPALNPLQGLGWYQYTYPGYTIWGHDGADNGYTSLIVYLPDENLAFALLTNGEGDLTDMSVGLLEFALSLLNSVPPSGCITTSLPENESNNLSIYPNPTSEGFFVKAFTSGALLHMYSSSGKLVRKVLLEDEEDYISVKDLKPGIYLIRLVNGIESVSSKLILTH